jgi:hypothetical protein
MSVSNEKWGCKSSKNQCRLVTRSGTASYYCCARTKGHRGPHVNAYVIHDTWMTREEWERDFGAAARTCYGQPSKRRRTRKGATRKRAALDATKEKK